MEYPNNVASCNTNQTIRLKYYLGQESSPQLVGLAAESNPVNADAAVRADDKGGALLATKLDAVDGHTARGQSWREL